LYVQNILFTTEAFDPCLLAAFCLIFFAYAEIHYKFKMIPSRYRIEAPEIIADVPLRVSPGADLPILILVKDAHVFPVKIDAVSVHISGGNGPKRVLNFNMERNITEPWWQRLLWIPRHHEDSGWREIKISFKINLFGRARLFMSDNYPLTHHRPFRCYFADELLPGPADYYTGDLHTHSNYTSDQVEFGAPPIAIAQMAKSMGHHFVAVTDHSYDLDDDFDNYLKNDPALKKWKVFLTEVRFCNTHFQDFVMIPGEEVSCGNKKGQNVHLLVFNNPEFIPGAGDSGEKWLRTKPDFSVAEITENGHTDSLYFAAHPETPVPFLQKLLLRRNTWRWQDYQHTKLNGLQIWNGHIDGMSDGRNSWIKLLLSGEKKFIIAGSDAHGNFNRFRQIGMPHLYMEEHETFHLYGQQRTTTYINNRLSLHNLLATLKNGAASITSGPFLAITGWKFAESTKSMMGETLYGEPAFLEITACSTVEFGSLSRIILFRGDLGAVNERVVLDETFPSKTFHFQTRWPLPPPAENGSYYRAEVICNSSLPLPVMAMTNPIWHVAGSE
jgi:hypothetical protein